MPKRKTGLTLLLASCILARGPLLRNPHFGFTQEADDLPPSTFSFNAMFTSPLET